MLAAIGKRAEGWIALTNGVVGEGRFSKPWSMPIWRGRTRGRIASTPRPAFGCQAPPKLKRFWATSSWQGFVGI
jgi:hypothetical protein